MKHHSAIATAPAVVLPALAWAQTPNPNALAANARIQFGALINVVPPSSEPAKPQQ